MSQTIVQTEGLTKAYGNRLAVDSLKLEVKQGDIYGFLGPNGAGKTTTIRMLLGLIRPTQGRIHIFGKDLRRERLSILGKVGALVEYPSYYGHLNAIENLEAIRRILNVPRSRIDEVLSIVRLTADAKRQVKGYSLGMKQRLGIAATLLGSPELLILDEPTNGLDPAGILEIRELIKSLPKEYGMTVLLSSHLLSEVEQMASHVGIINQGKLVFQDSLATLKNQASHQIQFHLSEPLQAIRTLEKMGHKGELGNDSVFVDALSNEQVAAIVHMLSQDGQSIYRITDKHQSLEDIFLQFTGGVSV
ncbi:ABC transporter ATP-binding protein [Paenibacillus marinisediminis]